MHHNQKGFTLVELLVGLAISSIIIAAAYGSYIVIKNNYDFQKDMKNISQSSRAVATMIMRDVRMAGYNFDDGPGKQNPIITNAIKIISGGTTSPDGIEIIYDQSFTERLKISYYTKPHTSSGPQRLRIYKKIERCDPSVNCGPGSLITVIPESPIADYVEDLQFTGYKNGNTLGTGNAIFGQGNMRLITSSDFSITAKEENAFPGVAKSGNISFAFDNDSNTMWSCNQSNANCLGTSGSDTLNVSFNKEVRLEKVIFRNGANIEGGSETPGDVASGNFNSITHPWGSEHGIYSVYNLQINATKCTWSSACTPVGQKFSGNTIIAYGQYYEVPLDIDFKQSVINKIGIRPVQTAKCLYSGTTCQGLVNHTWHEIAEIQFWGEVFGEAQEPQEVEIGLLFRSPDEHGNPIAQTWNIGDRSFTTNDGYIRDVYSISALVRNNYYGQ